MRDAAAEPTSPWEPTFRAGRAEGPAEEGAAGPEDLGARGPAGGRAG